MMLLCAKRIYFERFEIKTEIKHGIMRHINNLGKIENMPRDNSISLPRKSTVIEKNLVELPKI